MSVQVTTEIIGLQELDQALRDLRAEMTKRGEAGKEGNLVKNGLGAAARDVKTKMQFLAPRSQWGSHIDWHKSKNGKWVHGGEFGDRAEPGRLRRSIIVKYERRPRVLSEVVYVGPKVGKSRNDPNGAWYAAIVEMHGGEGGRGKGFMRKAITPEYHTRIIARVIGTGIERVAKRIGNENLRAVGARAKRTYASAKGRAA